MTDPSTRIDLLERETVNGTTKYTVQLTVPRIRDYKVLFRRVRYSEDPKILWATINKDGFPEIDTRAFWTTDREIADRLYVAAKEWDVPVEIMNYGPDAGRP